MMSEVNKGLLLSGFLTFLMAIALFSLYYSPLNTHSFGEMVFVSFIILASLFFAFTLGMFASRKLLGIDELIDELERKG